MVDRRSEFGNDGMSKSIRSLVDSYVEEKGDEVTTDIDLFLRQAREAMIGQKIVKIDCKPIRVPGEPRPFKGYTIATANMTLTFLGPQLTGMSVTK